MQSFYFYSYLLAFPLELYCVFFLISFLAALFFSITVPVSLTGR